MTELNENKGKELTFFQGLFREYELQEQIKRSFVKKDSTLRPDELNNETDFYIDPSMWKQLSEVCPDCPSEPCSTECKWRELNLANEADKELLSLSERELAEEFDVTSQVISRRSNYDKQLKHFLGSKDGGPKNCGQLESQIVFKKDNLNLSPDGLVLDYEDVKQYEIDLKFSDGGASEKLIPTGVDSNNYQTYGVEFKKNRLEDDAEVFTMKFANVLRLNENENLPDNNDLGKKTSDFFGNFGFYPNSIYKIDYDFSIGFIVITLVDIKSRK
jgi:hypothetical protein